MTTDTSNRGQPLLIASPPETSETPETECSSNTQLLPYRRACAIDRARPAQTKQIKFRARLPKVKTGCHNCKRIKCDEAKPGCVRCLKFGIVCSGYPKPQQKTKPKSRSIIPILPKGSTLEFLQPAIFEISSGPRFLDEHAGRYFRYFCEDVAANITGPLPSSVWSKIIPQVGEMEEYIANGLVAIGALSKARKELAEGRSPESKEHYQYALKQYGKSLRGINTAIEKGARRCPRTALIACILVFCIESMQGHQASASLHAANGVNMLLDCYEAFGKPLTPAQWSDSISLDADLSRALTELDLQVLYFIDVRPASYHITIKEGLNCQLKQSMPVVFEDLASCYQCWQLIMRRNLHFIDIARKSILIPEPHNDGRAFSPTEWDNGANFRQNNTPWGTADGSTCFPAEILAERDIYLAEIAHFEEASDAILKKCMTAPHHTEEFLVAASLRAHVAANTIRMRGSFFADEIEYDYLYPLFQTIVTCCTLVRPYFTALPSGYHTNLGILMPLFEVGVHCRNKILRDQAIAMLFVDKQYREGIWDSYTTGFICKWVRELEEPWRDKEGLVPMERRARLMGLNVMLEQRRAHIFCAQGNGLDGGVKMKDTIVTW
ncbi:zn2 cys6 dna-binding protein [Rutstroemia sp. NJR-2017a BVV2]|nr:zn2 cys6 dna-binding protein [Rutstroemia sp. NJR-2017a BVV2]